MSTAELAGRGSPEQPIPVWGGEGRDFGPGYGRIWPRGHWGGGGGHWGGWGGGGHWRHGGWGHGGWGHGGWGGWGSGFALGLGLGLPLGYYGGGYGGYDDPYYGDPGYYDVPAYRPRYRPRVYAPRYYNHGYNYNSANRHYQCDNLYQTGPVASACR
jgi:hypothetical protein